MSLSRPSLHPPVASADAHVAAIKAALTTTTQRRAQGLAAAAAQPSVVQIPLTTVSLSYNFDAYIDISFKGASPDAPTSLLLDSGNSMLVVPRWEDIAALPNFSADYQVLGASPEPWGCPANIVKGPVNLMTSTGALYSILDCVFYACTADSADGGGRTSNFGAGCLSPWTASGWNNLSALGVVLQAPLSYRRNYPFAEFNYAPSSTIFSSTADPHVTTGATLNLYRALPQGYQLLDILPNKEWMSLSPLGLKIGDVNTQWPGSVPTPPIAMIDTGGGPVFLSDPNGYIYRTNWPDPAANPGWTSGSQNCESTSDQLTITLGNNDLVVCYTIDPTKLPLSVQGLTLVACEVNQYMMGEQGMNIGGLSALFNYIILDYSTAKVGMKPKLIDVNETS
jgi:hypothetical protein